MLGNSNGFQLKKIVIIKPEAVIFLQKGGFKLRMKEKDEKRPKDKGLRQGIKSSKLTESISFK